MVVGGRAPGRAEALAARHPHATADSVEVAVRGSDVVLCCTGACEPVLRRTWLTEDAHVGSVGGSRGPELDLDTVRDGSLFVEWTGAVTVPLPAGAHELQGCPPERAALLGAVLDGGHPAAAIPANRPSSSPPAMLRWTSSRPPWPTRQLASGISAPAWRSEGVVGRPRRVPVARPAEPGAERGARCRRPDRPGRARAQPVAGAAECGHAPDAQGRRRLGKVR
ncbi:hypothetical protein ACFCX0_25790 [Streptomyces sp. NPDC056352]|uniref:hypothetical protein n=1 Tax=Streptomyces sp. NPDC056352 TaxID=3345791 RepID=UPI0035E2254C